MIVVANDLAIYNVYNYDIMYKNENDSISTVIWGKFKTRRLYPIIMAKHKVDHFQILFHTKVTCVYNI